MFYCLPDGDRLRRGEDGSRAYLQLRELSLLEHRRQTLPCPPGQCPIFPVDGSGATTYFLILLYSRMAITDCNYLST